MQSAANHEGNVMEFHIVWRMVIVYKGSVGSYPWILHVSFNCIPQILPPIKGQ